MGPRCFECLNSWHLQLGQRRPDALGAQQPSFMPARPETQLTTTPTLALSRVLPIAAFGHEQVAARETAKRHRLVGVNERFPFDESLKEWHVVWLSVCAAPPLYPPLAGQHLAGGKSITGRPSQSVGHERVVCNSSRMLEINQMIHRIMLLYSRRARQVWRVEVGQWSSGRLLTAEAIGD
jgi:hypothetical protein